MRNYDFRALIMAFKLELSFLTYAIFFSLKKSRDASPQACKHEHE
jgi:hypothetical protein